MTEQEILSRALRAAQAVTLGGMVAATAACDEPVPEFKGGEDAAGDTTADGSVDVADSGGTDTSGGDTPTPDVEADLSPPDTAPDAIEDVPEPDAEADAEGDLLADVEPDAETDAEPDAEPDADPDAVADADTPPEPDVRPDAPPEPDTDGATCKDTVDGICPEECTRDDDADCCNEVELCTWEPSWGCACAVPGPFVPPTMAA